MINYIIILSLILIYTYSICSIFGSINLWSEKDCDGLKGKLLKFGYKYSIYWTNFVGLWLSGTLQCSPFVVVSPWLLLGGVLMPICYSLSYKLCNDRFYIRIIYGETGYLGSPFFIIYNIKEWSWGFCYGLLMLIAVIGG